MRSLKSSPKGNSKYRIPLNRVSDFKIAVENMDTIYPKMLVSKDITALFHNPIPGFDGTLESLKTIPLSVLTTINTNIQTNQQRKTSKKSVEEKYKSYGIENLYDLLFNLPRRYIDKTNPQGVHDLVKGQDVTIIGTIEDMTLFNQDKGLNIAVKLNDGHSVRCSFFVGSWLKNLYKREDEIIVTGKFKPWKNILQISANTIDHLDSASNLPITPIYNQSASKGIKTIITMRAIMELISRLGEIVLPVYLQNIQSKTTTEQKTYADLIKAIHFPNSLQEREEAL